MWKPSDLICILHTYTHYIEHRNNIRHALYMYIFDRLGHGGGRKKENTDDWFDSTVPAILLKRVLCWFVCSHSFFLLLLLFTYIFAANIPVFVVFRKKLNFSLPHFSLGKKRIVFLCCQMSLFRFFPFFSLNCFFFPFFFK